MQTVISSMDEAPIFCFQSFIKYRTLPFEMPVSLTIWLMDLSSSLFCITRDLSDDGVCFGLVIYISYIGQLLYKCGYKYLISVNIQVNMVSYEVNSLYTLKICVYKENKLFGWLFILIYKYMTFWSILIIIQLRALYFFDLFTCSIMENRKCWPTIPRLL